jgi:hypothetical protein
VFVRWNALEVGMSDPRAEVLCEPGPRPEAGARGRTIVEDLAHLVGQARQGERLHNERDAEGHRPMLSNHLAGLSGHEQHLRLATHRPEPLCQLASVHACREDIGQQEMDGLRVSLRRPQGIPAIQRLQDAAPGVLENLPDQRADVPFLIHPANRFRRRPPSMDCSIVALCPGSRCQSRPRIVLDQIASIDMGALRRVLYIVRVLHNWISFLTITQTRS